MYFNERYKSKKEIVVDHTPVNLHAYHALERNYKDNKFYLVVRDPFTTVRGLAVRWANPYLSGEEREVMKCIQDAVFRWKRCAEEIISLKEKENTNIIKYEDFWNSHIKKWPKKGKKINRNS